MKDATTSYNWPDRKQVDGDRIDSYFELFLGRKPNTDAERTALLDLARQSPLPRIETLNHLIQKADFFDKNRDIIPLFLDLVVRARVFRGLIPPKTNLFCVGVARCGTTMVSAMLNSHSDVHIPSLKETNFFSHFSKDVVSTGFDNDIYGAYFIGWSGQAHLGDFSPVYLSDKRAIDGVFSYNPQAKIIVCVRNPVERAISAFFYTKDAHRYQDIYEYFLEGIVSLAKDSTKMRSWCAPEALLRQGLISSDISYVKSKFENVLIVEFREFENLDALYQRLCGFLGIIPESIADVVGGRINASKKLADGKVQKAQALLRDFYSAEVADFHHAHGISLLDES